MKRQHVVTAMKVLMAVRKEDSWHIIQLIRLGGPQPYANLFPRRSNMRTALIRELLECKVIKKKKVRGSDKKFLYSLNEERYGQIEQAVNILTRA
jgi:hypothetical protein